MSDVSAVVTSLGVSLGLGLLVGLQRERTEGGMAGFRTFPLVTMLGTICGILGQTFGGWIVAAGFVGLAALIFVANLKERTKGPVDPGMTTEVSLLLLFGVGVFLTSNPIGIGITIGATVAILLHLKPQMHSWAGKIEERDFRAIMRFVLLSMVILPILPNQTYGPYHVLNPFAIWLFVVLIVGINLGGYALYKFLGQSTGTLLAGLVGGLISSTATTFMYARRSREHPESAGVATVVITLASAVVFVRVLLVVAVVVPSGLLQMVAPLGIIGVAMTAACFLFWRFIRRERSRMPAQSNPTEIKAALMFAAIFAVILLGVAAAKQYFGSRGLYGISALSGLVDVDAITLSVSQMLKSSEVDSHTAWRLILVAALSNLVFKAGIVAVLGSRKLLMYVGMLFGFSIAIGVALLLFGASPLNGFS